MKQIFYKSLLLLAAAATFPLVAQAQAYLQDPKYGDSPEARTKNVLNLNYFNDSYKNKNYDQATHYMRLVIEGAPKASQNLYINGINIYRTKAAEATTADQRQVYIDSLMTLYDLRIEYFGDDPNRGRPYLLGLKARDYLSLNADDQATVKKLFGEAIEASGDDADPELVNIYFHSLVDAYTNDEISTNDLLDAYDRLSKVFEKSTVEDVAEQKALFDNLFVSSGAASCENLEKVYKPSVDANPNDKDLLNKVFRLLYSNQCKSDFQIEVSEKLYKLEPSSSVALLLASALEERKEYARARNYLNEAIAVESDPQTKANLAVRIAAGELAQNNTRSAADFARQALDIDPNNGLAYWILGNAYSAGAASCSGFDRQTVFWLVVDTLTKAKELLAADAPQRASIDSQIASSRSYFPSSEEGFFRGLENGQGHTVSCGWISGRTTVRLNR